jgi:hypothetical protein
MWFILVLVRSDLSLYELVRIRMELSPREVQTSPHEAGAWNEDEKRFFCFQRESRSAEGRRRHCGPNSVNFGIKFI